MGKLNERKVDKVCSKVFYSLQTPVGVSYFLDFVYRWLFL